MNTRKVGVSILLWCWIVWLFFILSGFDYSRHSIPLDDISDGGPDKDGIPSIGSPHFLTVAEADQSLM